jgi:hypothetical protein
MICALLAHQSSALDESSRFLNRSKNRRSGDLHQFLFVPPMRLLNRLRL